MMPMASRMGMLSGGGTGVSTGSTGVTGSAPMTAGTVGSAGNTGSAGSSWGRQTFGHDTHDRTNPNDDDEERHVPGLFNDRRKEGRRHTPTDTFRVRGPGPGPTNGARVKKHAIEESMEMPPMPARMVRPHQRHLN